MYRGFNLQIGGIRFENPYHDRYIQAGADLNAEHQRKVKAVLDDFVSGSGELDGSKMTANWFPQIEADIFLSHSRRNQGDAILLAGWLKEAFGLTCFIDSCAWGHADQMLRLIDNKYCLNADEKSYSYPKRNLSTAHVHMMLTTALSKMIDQAECVFFLNTPQSIRPKDAIDESIETTFSPWIYSEIAMTSLVRKRTPDQHRKGHIKKALAKTEERDLMKISYDVDLDHLLRLTLDDLNNWQERLDGKKHSLDVLYALKDSDE